MPLAYELSYIQHVQWHFNSPSEPFPSLSLYLSFFHIPTTTPKSTDTLNSIHNKTTPKKLWKKRSLLSNISLNLNHLRGKHSHFCLSISLLLHLQMSSITPTTPRINGDPIKIQWHHNLGFWKALFVSDLSVTVFIWDPNTDIIYLFIPFSSILIFPYVQPALHSRI